MHLRGWLAIAGLTMSSNLAAQAVLPDGPSIDRIAQVETYTAPLQPGMFADEKHVLPLLFMLRFPVFPDTPATLPMLIEHGDAQALTEGTAVPGLYHRVFADRVELHWLASVDRKAQSASLCRLTVRPDRLERGAGIVPSQLIRYVPGPDCAFAKGKLPLALVRPYPGRERVLPPAKVHVTRAFSGWKVSVVSAARGAPPVNAFVEKAWGGDDAPLALNVDARDIDNATGLRGAYWEFGVPYDPRVGAVLRFTRPDMVKLYQDDAYRLAACRFTAASKGRDAPAGLPQLPEAFAWCAEQVLATGKTVPDFPRPAPPPPPMPPRPAPASAK